MNTQKKPWSLKEEILLKEIYPNCSIKELLESFPDRSYKCILTKSSRLKIKRSKEAISKAISKGNKGKLVGDKNTSKRPEVRKKISQGLKGRVMSKETRRKIGNWSLEDELKLMGLYPRFSWKTLLKEFPNRTKSSIYQKAHKLGIKKGWSEREINILKKYYPDSGIKQVHILLPHRTKNAIKHKAIELNIKRKKGMKHNDRCF